MIPPTLLRLLPPIGITLALITAIWWTDHRGYRRAMADRDARDARLLGQLQAELRDSERRLAASMAGIESDYEAARRSISRTSAALQPIIIEEAAHDPRLSNPALGLTPSLFHAVNRAREAGACTTAATGRIDCAMPATFAATESDDR